ncbi:MAG: 30S ribosomal protein S17 [Candidatus Woesearchaeota archaeon]
MARTRDTGFEVAKPNSECTDVNCPFHGSLKVRGKQFTGRVASHKMQNSVIVEWLGWKYVPKYERYTKTKTRISVHNPPCINAREGDLVKIGECRPLSKTKNFVVLQVFGKDELYQLEKESLEEGKHKIKKSEAENKAASASTAPKSKDKPSKSE